jgi:hypothetical protein
VPRIIEQNNEILTRLERLGPADEPGGIEQSSAQPTSGPAGLSPEH